MSKGNIADFNGYLISCVKMPYVYGGQHTKLTPENYEKVIDRHENNGDGYKNKEGAIIETYNAAAKAYCKAMFAHGYSILYSYDCSGLGMYWLQNLMRLFKSDMNCNSMWHHCEDADKPQNGYWVFRVKDLTKPRTKQVASHIGYCVEIDGAIHIIHAKGRKYGVVDELWKKTKSYWHYIGKPDCMDFSVAQQEPEQVPVEEIPASDPEPVQEAPQTPQEPIYKPGEIYVRVVGGMVHIRRKGTKFSKKLHTALRGDTFRLIGYAPSGWYRIDFDGDPDAYISNKPCYTRLYDAEAIL